MKIIKLHAENVKRLKAVDISTNGESVVIAGRNEQGKSSVLDSIMYALGGKSACPESPIRAGEDAAKVVVDLGDLIVTRRWTHANSYLEVASADGATYKSPQAILDGLVGKLSFDPLAFARMTGKQRRDTLLGCVEIGIDLNAFEQQRAAAYSERRDIGRDLKQAEAELRAIPAPEPGHSTAEISIADAAADLRRQVEVQRSLEAAENRESESFRALGAARSRRDEAKAALAAAEQALTTAAAAHAEAVAALDAHPDPAIEAAQTALDTIEQHNAAARAARQYEEAVAKVDRLRTAYTDLDSQIAELDQEKSAALEAADMPLDGLGLSESDVLLNGVTFEQLSTSQKIKFGFGIAMRLNPKLRVIRIQSGNDLDSDSLQAIQEMASADDYQLWIERIDPAGALAVVIEDGAVREVRP